MFFFLTHPSHSSLSPLHQIAISPENSNSINTSNCVFSNPSPYCLTQNKDGETALTIAQDRSQADMVQLLRDFIEKASSNTYITHIQYIHIYDTHTHK